MQRSLLLAMHLRLELVDEDSRTRTQCKAVSLFLESQDHRVQELSYFIEESTNVSLELVWTSMKQIDLYESIRISEPLYEHSPPLPVCSCLTQLLKDVQCCTKFHPISILGINMFDFKFATSVLRCWSRNASRMAKKNCQKIVDRKVKGKECGQPPRTQQPGEVVEKTTETSTRWRNSSRSWLLSLLHLVFAWVGANVEMPRDYISQIQGWCSSPTNLGKNYKNSAQWGVDPWVLPGYALETLTTHLNLDGGRITCEKSCTHLSRDVLFFQSQASSRLCDPDFCALF